MAYSVTVESVNDRVRFAQALIKFNSVFTVVLYLADALRKTHEKKLYESLTQVQAAKLATLVGDAAVLNIQQYQSEAELGEIAKAQSLLAAKEWYDSLRPHEKAFIDLIAANSSPSA